MPKYRARWEGPASPIRNSLCAEPDYDRSVALAWKLRDRGLTVPWLDVIIAALALHDDVRLYTLDTHFSSIAEITGLRLYQPGCAGMFVPEEDA